MKLSETKEAFYESSATLSDNVRQLLLAGIAIIWILKTGDKTAAGVPFSKILILPLQAFIAGLICDALQYAYKTLSWWFYHKAKYQAGLKDDSEVDPPTILSAPTWLFFILKLVACAIGYYYLLRYLSTALR